MSHTTSHLPVRTGRDCVVVKLRSDCVVVKLHSAAAWWSSSTQSTLPVSSSQGTGPGPGPGGRPCVGVRGWTRVVASYRFAAQSNRGPGRRLVNRARPHGGAATLGPKLSADTRKRL